MKKMLAILLVVCLSIGLCACGSKDTKTTNSDAKTTQPKDWDTIAEATATLNQYLACETEENFRAVCHSSYSNNDIKMMAKYQEEYLASWPEDISKKFVRKVKQIDTYKGNDVFFYTEGYETTDGYRTPADPLPTSKVALNMQISSQTYSIIVLAIENGRYVLANVPTNEWKKYLEDFSFCTCDLGTVLIPGDPCKSCDGVGYLAEESNDDSEFCVNDDFVSASCLTCGGDSVLDDETACPDCTGALMIRPFGITSMADLTPCPDCDGTGLENYTYGDCPDCDGKGYNK